MLAPPLLAISTVVSVKDGAAEGQKMPIESDGFQYEATGKDLSKRVVRLNVRPQTRLSRYTSDDRLFPKPHP